MLKFNNVTKQFSENSYGVREVTFEVEPGEFLFVTGRSGSGKTTLMRLLTKEYTPTEGEIIFEDLVVNQIKNSQLHQLRRRIGVVFQNYRLLPELNVWENIALPLSIIGKDQEEIEDRITDLLRLVELTDKAMLFPRQLSGGEAQRISIARALATGPSVIFADEPTGNLDHKTSLKISRLLDKINELGTTVIFATHDTNVLDQFSGLRTLHLKDGELVKETGERRTSEAAKELDKDPAEELAEEEKDVADDEEEKDDEEKDQLEAEKEEEVTEPTEDDSTKTDDEKQQDKKKKGAKTGGFLSRFFKKSKGKKQDSHSNKDNEVEQDKAEEDENGAEDEDQDEKDDKVKS